MADPKEDKFALELVVAASASAIVIHNVKDFREARRFGIQVWKPRILLGKNKRESMIRTVILPEDLYHKAAKLAAREHLSVDEFVSAALAEQVTSREYLDKWKARFSREYFENALAQIPDCEPEDYDKL